MEDSLIYYMVTFLIALLASVAKYYHGKAEKAEKSQIVETAEGIKRSVDSLSTSVNRLATDTARAFEKGERRMDSIEGDVSRLKTRISVVETKCELTHPNIN